MTVALHRAIVSRREVDRCGPSRIAVDPQRGSIAFQDPDTGIARILVVDDDAELASLLRMNLELEGYAVSTVDDGLAGLSSARGRRPDLVILDLMLPKLDGCGLLRALRADGYDGAVLVLSGRADQADKVRGFRLGADDYVTKPFGLLELLARIGALLRRSAASSRARANVDVTPLRFGGVEVRPEAYEVLRVGKHVALSPKKFDLMMSLFRRRGAVATRTELLREVWGYDTADPSRTVDTHIAQLRRKLEIDPSAPRHVLTVRKRGYRLVLDEMPP